jgi:hypothetical protein
MNKTLRQVSLKSENIGMTTWVDDKPGLREGVLITLKTYIEPDRKWLVERMYEGTKEEGDFIRNFDNNNYDKHVGLWKKTK